MGIFPFSGAGGLIGLDISCSHFRAAHVTAGSSKPTLTNYAAIKVPVGTVIEGEIVDVDAAADSLAQLWRKSSMSGRDVIVGVASQKVVVRLISIPFMEKSELASAIQFQAQDYIPIPVQDAIIDAQVLSQFLGENDEKMMEVLLVAAQKDMISNTVAAVEKAGLKPQVIDLSAFALVRSLLGGDGSGFFLPSGEEDAPGAQATALINVSSGITNIVVVEDGHPKFARVTSVAGDDLTKAIVDATGVTFEDAELLKVNVGLPGFSEEPDDIVVPEALKAHVSATRNVLEAQMSYFVGEIRRSLDYYLTQSVQAHSVGRVVVSGNGSSLRNFCAHLEKGLQVKAEIGDVISRVQVGPKLSAESLSEVEPSLAVPLGLALREL